MRCPNCSFLNTDDTDVCKICGYELVPQKSSEKHFSLDDDEELDRTVDALFGTAPSKTEPSTDGISARKDTDGRFAAYADMSDEPDEPITDKELEWLEMLKRDIADVDEEFNTLKGKQTNGKGAIHTSETAQETGNDTLQSDIPPDNADITDEREPEIADTNGDAEDMDDYEVINLQLLSSNTTDLPGDQPSPPEAQNDSFEDQTEDPSDSESVETAKLPQNNPEYYDYTNTSHEDAFRVDIERKRIMRNRLIVIIGTLLVIVLIFVKLAGNNSEDVLEAVTDTSGTENQSEAVVEHTDYAETISEQTGIFFGQLKSYVNDGNIAVLSRFENSQHALEQLNTFKNAGTLDDFKLTMPSSIDAAPEGTPVMVEVDMTRTVNDTSSNKASTWYFNWVLIEDQWLISNLDIQSQDSTTTVGDSSNTASTDNNTANSQNDTQTTEQTSDVIPDGFISTGSFTGGIITDGQDISGIRFGRHESFERIVFDLSVWTETATLVDSACHYEATISDNGVTITLVLSGARGASAVVPDLSGSSYISSIATFYPEDDSMVGFTIKLKQGSLFKVFDLASPGKIVVDVMPD